MKRIFGHILLLAIGMLLLTCSRGPIRPADGTSDKAIAAVKLKVADPQIASSVKTLTLTVSGEDFVEIAKDIAVNGLTGLRLTDTIEVPVGSNRVVTIVAKDAAGNIVYRGMEKFNVLDASSTLAIEVLMFQVLERVAAFYGILASYGASTCSLNASFYAIPTSLPAKLGVNDYAIGQFFGSENALSGYKKEGSLVSWVPSSADGHYHIWSSFDGDTAYVDLAMPDTGLSFNISTSTAPAGLDSPAADISFDLGSSITASWTPVAHADYYWVTLGGWAVIDSANLGQRGSVGTEFNDTIYIEVTKLETTSTVIFPPEDFYYGHGYFGLMVTPLNGAMPVEGQTSNVKGAVRGMAIAYDVLGAKAIRVATGQGFAQANSTYLLSMRNQMPSINIAQDDPSNLFALCKGLENKRDQAYQALHITKARVARMDTYLDVVTKVFSDPVTLPDTIICNGKIISDTGVAIGEQREPQWITVIEDSIIDMGMDSACTLSVKMKDGEQGQAIVAIPDSMADSLTIIGSEYQTMGAASSVILSWDSVSNAKGYIVRFEPEGKMIAFMDTIVYDTFFVVMPKYFEQPGNILIKVVPFNGINPYEVLASPNIVSTVLAKSNGLLSALTGSFWAENQYGQHEVSIMVQKASEYLSFPEDFDIGDFPCETGTFSNDFNNGMGDWCASGFWHVTSSTPSGHQCGDSKAIWYGQDATGDFDNGQTNWGWLVSPTTPDIAFGEMLQFCSWSDIEHEAPYSYDFRVVFITTNGGQDWTEIWREQGNAHEQEWYQVAIPLDAYEGKPARFRFMFNTGDGLYNDHGGWYVDDIMISTSLHKRAVVVEPAASIAPRKIARKELALPRSR